MAASGDDRSPPSPLAQTLARLRLANPYLRVHLGNPGEFGGFSLPAILEDDPPLLDAHLAAMAAQYQTDEQEVLARFYLSGFSFHLAHFAVGVFMREQRVPVLEPASLGLTYNKISFPIALSLCQEQFFCLRSDDAAHHPAALPVDGEAALRAQLRSQVVIAYQPLISALRKRARLGERALWIAAAETCANVLVEALPPRTSASVARAKVESLLGHTASPLRANPEIVSATGDDRSPFGVLGHDCCAMFRLPNQPYCTTCPHLPYEQRVAALRAWLVAKADRKPQSGRENRVIHPPSSSRFNSWKIKVKERRRGLVHRSWFILSHRRRISLVLLGSTCSRLSPNHEWPLERSREMLAFP